MCFDFQDCKPRSVQIVEVERNALAGCEFWQNQMSVVGEHNRSAGDGGYRTLEFKGKTDYRFVRLYMQDDFGG